MSLRRRLRAWRPGLRRRPPGPVAAPFPCLAAAAAAAVAVAGCGDTLVDARYHGEPLLTLNGAVSVLASGRLGDQEACRRAREACSGVADAQADAAARRACNDAYDECLSEQAADAAPWETGDADLRVALFWSRTDSAAAVEADDSGDDEAGADSADPADDEAVLEQAVEATGGFPASYELTVYSPPPASVLRTSAAGEFGLAVVLVYLDQDGDGRWDGGADRIVGGAAPAGVLYAPTEWGGFAAGFHQVEIPRGCPDQALALSEASEELVDLRLSIAPTHLDGLLPDVDCDRSTVDWPMCPDRAALLEECRVEGGRPPDPWRCILCAGRPPGGPVGDPEGPSRDGPPESRDGFAGGAPERPDGSSPPDRPPPQR